MTAGRGWTVADAIADFDASGAPGPRLTPYKLTLLRRVFSVTHIAERESGAKGGRGERLYPVGDLQELHAMWVRWWEKRPPPGGDS